jgi:hypothetical protein
MSEEHFVLATQVPGGFDGEALPNVVATTLVTPATVRAAA